MQLSNIPGKLVLPFANAGGKSTIPVASQIGITAGAASLTDGFPPLTRTLIAAGGVPPSGLDMNGILYELSAVSRWANAGGGYPFDGTFATDVDVGGYPKGARIMRSDGLGYWFNTTDNNVTDPNDAGAVAAGWVPDFTTGIAAVTMTSANVTLTPLQYGKPTIVITGALTGNLNLIFPNITGRWDVINSTTGGYTITAKTAAGTGSVIYRGIPNYLCGDGSNIYSPQNDTLLTIKMFGAIGDGTADDSVATGLANSSNQQVIFTPGTYLLTANTTFTKAPVFMEGAVLKVRGAIVTFSNGIDAGYHTIFDTTDDFIVNPIALTSVVIRACNVKADWFCSKVPSAENILTIADQTNNLTKAYRAAVGNYTVASGSNWNTQYPDGVLELGAGYYRVDGKFAWGTQIASVYYKVTGFKMIGAGVNASYLVRTNMASTDYVLFGAFYTGELTVADEFKITAYNPSGVTDAQKYSSAAKALAFFQGDSLFIGEIWVSGGQTYTTDSNGVFRNGVGVQFSSCIDTYFDKIFTEYCVTGVAFASSIVSGNNLEVYTSLGQSIGLGCFVADWPDTQTTSSTVNITNIQARACANNAITTIEAGDVGALHITTSLFDGYNSEMATNVGNVFCDMITGTSLLGSISNSSINNFHDSTFRLHGTASLGRATGEFAIRDVYCSGQTFDISAGFINADTTAYANVLVDGVSLETWGGVLLLAPNAGNIRMLNISLSEYHGKSDSGPNRLLFVSPLACSIQIIGVTRNAADTEALNQFGYATGGNIFIDIDNLYNATRLVSGGATVKMPTKVAFA